MDDYETNSANGIENHAEAENIQHGIEPLPESAEELIETSAETDSARLIEADISQAFYNEMIVKPTEPKRVKWRLKIAALIIVCTLGAGCAGLGIGAGSGYVRHRLEASARERAIAAAKSPADSAAPSAAPTVGRQNGLTMADIFAKTATAVVSIDTYSKGNSYRNIPAALNGAGSGIVFFESELNVYIATNYHVISGSSALTVAFGESDFVAATAVGGDSLADLAVISVARADMEAAGITEYSVARFGDSDIMSVGDPVMAIGNAMGEGTSASSGIVSAVNKELSIQGRRLTTIQTNAAINPGSSGGPLMNMRGEVIGINTAKLSNNVSPYDIFGGVTQTTIEGMGYSISSNVAKPILEDIMHQRSKPFLGIQGGDLPEDIADEYGIPAVGVYVAAVFEGSSAEAAGIAAGDIITAFNGKTIFTMAQLQEEVRGCRVGDKVEVKILRDGTTPVTLTAKLTANQSTP